MGRVCDTVGMGREPQGFVGKRGERKIPLERPWFECAYNIKTSFISNLSDDRHTASSKTIPPLNAI
jgi:hypothetical protein